MGELWVPLTGQGVATELVGAKGAALDRLVARGFPVPASAALTAEAYRRFVAEAGLAAFLRELAGEPVPPVAELGDEQRRVEEAFASANVPSDVRAAVEEAVAHVGSERLAIRSSATAEDTASASFAGQYRSELDVAPLDVVEHVALVWASLWSPAVRAYRAAAGVASGDLAMGVVVMAMVDARQAGVVFTADPERATAALRVELVEGLGERLVSGAVTPTVHVLPRREAALADEPEVPEVARTAAWLALRIEGDEGAPQDVEWAADRERVWIVQTRPITSRAAAPPPDDDGLDSDLDPHVTYTPAGVAEMLPDILPPLTWSVTGPLVEEGFRRVLDDVGVDVASLDGPLVVRARGRAALDLDALERAAAAMPGGSAEDVERQYFGEVLDREHPEPPPRARGRLGAMRAALRAAALRRRLLADAEIAYVAVDAVLDRAPDCASLTDADVRRYRGRIRSFAKRVVALQVGTAAASAAAYRNLELLLERFAPGEDAAALAGSLTAGAIPAAGGGLALGVDEIVADIAGDEELVAAVHAADPAAGLRSAGDAGRALLERWERARRRAGSTAVPGGPTWDEDPATAWAALQAALDLSSPEDGRTLRPAHEQDEGEASTPADEELRAFERQLTRSWRWRGQRLITGQVVDLRVRLLRRFITDARGLLTAREALKVASLRIGGEIRRSALEIGRRLASGGHLDDDADVELLTEGELLAALAGDPPDRSVLDRRRRALVVAADAGPLPRLFMGRPAVEEEAEAEEAGGNRFHGMAASGGRHRGAARVVHALADAELGQGDVLVARTTDPSWTPLFLSAGAIVVEEGGPLSHAAIVARELGRPAVLNIPGIVERIEDGIEVTVDGDAGIVVLHAGGPGDRDEGSDSDRDGDPDSRENDQHREVAAP